jgi:hypothetical protein
MSSYTLNDIPIKTAFGADLKAVTDAKLPSNLYQLLVVVNGSRSVADLLRFGIRGVDIDSFAQLEKLQFITRASSSVSAMASVAMKPASTKGLAEARFAVLDLLLDLSERDFGVRPWIDKIEKVHSIAGLLAQIDAFCASPLGQKYSEIHPALKRAAT